MFSEIKDFIQEKDVTPFSPLMEGETICEENPDWYFTKEKDKCPLTQGSYFQPFQPFVKSDGSKWIRFFSGREIPYEQDFQIKEGDLFSKNIARKYSSS